MSAPDPRSPAESSAANGDRRAFMSTASSAAMAFGLAGGYGMFGALAGRYLYPAKPPQKRWMFVATLNSLAAGASLIYQAPSGHAISITRLKETGAVDDFIALSSICPHLGCQVHWETQNQRFFCPCHNGAFNAEGIATAGPPYDARQQLSRYPLKIENDLLFIEVPVA
jgi:cytochrome b6-f complex iron-sulfur subunit